VLVAVVVAELNQLETVALDIITEDTAVLVGQDRF
jgi:hypothetical protein